MNKRQCFGYSGSIECKCVNDVTLSQNCVILSGIARHIFVQ